MDDRDWSWLPKAAPAPPEAPERPLWRLTKDGRIPRPWYLMPHGAELCITVAGEFLTSQLYRDGDVSPELATFSTGMRPTFIGKGWTAVE